MFACDATRIYDFIYPLEFQWPLQNPPPPYSLQRRRHSTVTVTFQALCITIPPPSLTLDPLYIEGRFYLVWIEKEMSVIDSGSTAEVQRNFAYEWQAYKLWQQQVVVTATVVIAPQANQPALLDISKKCLFSSSSSSIYIYYTYTYLFLKLLFFYSQTII